MGNHATPRVNAIGMENFCYLQRNDPGIHHPEAQTCWRRVRVAKDSALVEVLRNAGFDIEPDFKDPDRTVIARFAVKDESVKPVTEVSSMDIELDQVVIGSCTNGRIEDLRITAKILKNKKINPNLRCIIIPGTQETYLRAIKEGLIEILVNAGAIVSTPTCGPCLGGHMGILGEGEKALSTTNRNFKGRMGHISSEIYLASPAVAAFSAVKGYITSPQLN